MHGAISPLVSTSYDNEYVMNITEKTGYVLKITERQGIIFKSQINLSTLIMEPDWYYPSHNVLSLHVDLHRSAVVL